MLQNISHRHFYYAGLHGLVWSILFSKAGISILIGLLVLLSIVRIQSISPVKTYLNKAFFSTSTYRQSKWYYALFVGFFLLTCFSYFNSENTSEWWHFIKLKMPYLLLPIVFMNHQSLDRHVYHQLYLSLIIAVAAAAVWVMIHYVLDWAAITDSIGYGKSIATPLSHVKFSVLMTLACMASVVLSQLARFNKGLMLAIAAFLCISLHVLAVRSGLVVLYLVGATLLMYYYWKMGRKLMIGFIVLAFLAVPVISYYTIPSVHQKVHYVKYDLRMMQQGNTANYSDGERVRSLQIGWDIIQKNLVFGAGIGDIRDIVNEYYTDWFPDSSKKILPHNQYLLAWASYGLIGLLLFLLCLIGVLYGRRIINEPLLYCLVLTIVIYGLVEKPLDEYVFVAVHALFGCAAISTFSVTHNKNQN